MNGDMATFSNAETEVLLAKWAAAAIRRGGIVKPFTVHRLEGLKPGESFSFYRGAETRSTSTLGATAMPRRMMGCWRLCGRVPSSTSHYSRHVAYAPDGARVVTTRSSYGNSSFWATFHDQLERKVTTGANGQHMWRRREFIARATAQARGRCARIRWLAMGLTAIARAGRGRESHEL
jgi:hypothetical protein